MYREINDYEMLYLICDSDDNYEIIFQKYYPFHPVLIVHP